jgi:hypothetical protein
MILEGLYLFGVTEGFNSYPYSNNLDKFFNENFYAGAPSGINESYLAAVSHNDKIFVAFVNPKFKGNQGRAGSHFGFGYFFEKQIPLDFLFFKKIYFDLFDLFVKDGDIFSSPNLDSVYKFNENRLCSVEYKTKLEKYDTTIQKIFSNINSNLYYNILTQAREGVKCLAYTENKQIIADTLDNSKRTIFTDSIRASQDIANFDLKLLSQQINRLNIEVFNLKKENSDFSNIIKLQKKRLLETSRNEHSEINTLSKIQKNDIGQDLAQKKWNFLVFLKNPLSSNLNRNAYVAKSRNKTDVIFVCILVSLIALLFVVGLKALKL